MGLYALWKSNTITKGWKVGWSIIIFIFAISLLGSEDNTDIKVEIAGKSTAESTEVDTSKKLNVSYEQAINFSNSFKMEKLRSWEGVPAFGGNNTENNYYLNIVGFKDNIIVANLVVPAPSIKKLSKSTTLKQFLKNIELQNSLGWIVNTYSKLYEQSKNKGSFVQHEDSKNFENKNIQLLYNDGGNELYISIEHKDLE
ncbi:MAG TPA: hypothetical protein VF181_09580 [Balneolaceae bacterium]